MNPKVIYALSVAVGIILVTTAVVYYARGYRFDLSEKKVSSTGVLRVTSSPAGASVYIEGKLITATEDIINLQPGTYQVRIEKEGFLPWEKEVFIEKEIVASLDAWLRPAVPSLRPLTFKGVKDPVLSPDGRKIVYGSDNLLDNQQIEEFAAKKTLAPTRETDENGLWVFEMKSGGLPLLGGSSLRLIVKDSALVKFSGGQVFWAPDSRQVLVKVDQAYYLLDTDSFVATAKPLTPTVLELTLNQWQEKIKLEQQAQLSKLNPKLLKVVEEALAIKSFSPDESKILYQAKKDYELTSVLETPYIGANSQPEQRRLEKGKIYVYDVRQDRNYLVGESNQNAVSEKPPPARKDKTSSSTEKETDLSFLTPSFHEKLKWLPTSSHLLEILADRLIILDYDGTNRQTIYAGPFENSHAFPWPDASRLVVLTSFNKAISEKNNLYAIDLK